ncbi:MAG: glycoside hydrolase family 28 protein [Bryobacteraceae bacterium]
MVKELPLLFLAGMSALAGTFNVRDYGAAGNGVRKDTAAIARAVDACAKAGGGAVLLPPGRYLTGSIELKSNVTLEIEAGATILGSTDPADYAVAPNAYMPERSELTGLIWGRDLVNVTVKGRGTVDGQGKTWWERQWAASPKKGRPAPSPAATAAAKKALVNGRPYLLKLVRCKNVLVEGLTFVNSPAWTIHPVMCEFVNIHALTIVNPVPSPNTDGINPESCRNVHISNCHIDVGDDCITLKSGKDEAGRRAGRPNENITVTNCTMLKGHGGVVIGSEMSGGVRNVTVSNCVFNGTDIGIRVKSQRGRGGVVEGVAVSNIVMQDVPEAFTITTFYQGSDQPGEIYPVNDGTPVFRDFRISNITARGSKSAGQITGLKEMPVSGISFSHVRIAAARGFRLRNAKGIEFHDVQILPGEGPALFGDNVEDLHLDGFRNTVDLKDVGDVFVDARPAVTGRKPVFQLP